MNVFNHLQLISIRKDFLTIIEKIECLQIYKFLLFKMSRLKNYLPGQMLYRFCTTEVWSLLKTASLGFFSGPDIYPKLKKSTENINYFIISE